MADYGMLMKNCLMTKKSIISTLVNYWMSLIEVVKILSKNTELNITLQSLIVVIQIYILNLG